mgnify:CR=1 FL=1
MTFYSIYKRGKVQATAQTLDEARSMGAFILKKEDPYGSINVFMGTKMVGHMEYDYKVDLFFWAQGVNEPVKIVDPITGKAKAFPKGMYLIKYMKNGAIKENIINAKSMDDLRKKIIGSVGEASAENSKFLGNVMYREGRYIWRVPVDLKKYIFRDTDIDPRTGKLKGAPRDHAPFVR